MFNVPAVVVSWYIAPCGICCSEPCNSLCKWETHTTVLRPFFWDHPGEPVPEENFCTLWCKGRLTGRHSDHPAGRHCIRTNQCPPPPSPPYFLQARCPFCRPNNSVKALKALVWQSRLKVCTQNAHDQCLQLTLSWSGFDTWWHAACRELSRCHTWWKMLHWLPVLCSAASGCQNWVSRNDEHYKQ